MRALSGLPSVIALVALMSGCAAPSQPKAMIAFPASQVHQSRETVSVNVSGGKETSSLGASQVSDKAFAQALRDSIEKAGLFAQAVEGGAGTYRLDAYIGELSQPLMGFDLTVTMEVSYILTDARSQYLLWKKPISSTYTATIKDSIVGVTRLQMANEGAARKNIEQAMAEISQLDLE